MTDTAEKRTNKVRDVKYPLKDGSARVLEDLPEANGRLRSSPMEEALMEIKEHTEVHGRWVEIASYGNGGAATGMANELRKRHGFTANWQGWEFATARADEDGDPRVGLFAKYDPKAITEHGEQAHNDEAAKRKARAAVRSQKMAATKAKNKH